MLWTQPAASKSNHSPWILDLSESFSSFGNRPFPVVSLPITLSGLNNANQKSFTAKGKGKGGENQNSTKKQEQIERYFTIPELPASDDSLDDAEISKGSSRILMIREETSYDLDKVCDILLTAVIHSQVLT